MILHTTYSSPPPPPPPPPPPTELGIYPAVDPLDSTSRIMDPNVVGEEHYNVARGVQKILQVMMVWTWHMDDIIMWVRSSGGDGMFRVSNEQ